MEMISNGSLGSKSWQHLQMISHDRLHWIDVNKTREDLLENGGLPLDGFLADGMAPFDAIIDGGFPPNYDTSAQNVGWKQRAKLVLPHVGLIILTSGYTLLGALLFYMIERSEELDRKAENLQNVNQIRHNIEKTIWDHREELHDLNDLQNLTNLTSYWREYNELLYKSYEKDFMNDKEVNSNTTMPIWTFKTAIFFAITVVTTIGYGNPVPVTELGRIWCIIFALFGVPLTLITIADIGKFFGEHLVWLYSKYIRCKHNLKDKLVAMKLKAREKEEYKDRKKHAEICSKCKAYQNLVQMQSEKRIPATLVISILIGYTALGALLMNCIERWSYFESFYFCFITMTTVGFGDMTPTKSGQIFVLLAYILLGLALCTMCIDIVGVQYVRKIHYFGRKIRHAGTALAIVGDKAVYISEMLQKRFDSISGPSNHPRVAIALKDGGILIDNIYFPRHMRPFIPGEIKIIKYIDEGSESFASSTNSLVDSIHECHMCKTMTTSFTNANTKRSYDLLQLD